MKIKHKRVMLQPEKSKLISAATCPVVLLLHMLQTGVQILQSTLLADPARRGTPDVGAGVCAVPFSGDQKLEMSKLAAAGLRDTALAS